MNGNTIITGHDNFEYNIALICNRHLLNSFHLIINRVQ